jgi:hypothetical protein
MTKLFKNLTSQARLVLWLESMGYTQTDTKSSKYIALTKPGMGDARYFIGKAGAFRRGPNVTNSVSLTPLSSFCLWCIEQENK